MCIEISHDNEKHMDRVQGVPSAANTSVGQRRESIRYSTRASTFTPDRRIGWSPRLVASEAAGALEASVHRKDMRGIRSSPSKSDKVGVPRPHRTGEALTGRGVVRETWQRRWSCGRWCNRQACGSRRRELGDEGASWTSSTATDGWESSRIWHEHSRKVGGRRWHLGFEVGARNGRWAPHLNEESGV